MAHQDCLRARFDKEKYPLWHIRKIHMHFEKVADPNPRFPLFGWRKIVVPWHIRPGMGRLANPLPFLQIPIPGFPKGGR